MYRLPFWHTNMDLYEYEVPGLKRKKEREDAPAVVATNILGHNRVEPELEAAECDLFIWHMIRERKRFEFTKCLLVLHKNLRYKHG
uniref:Uncharacterized protein n=1 Tax=Arundo donax TaxID=35708 RepID=A0A0A9CVG0_ARUDO